MYDIYTPPKFEKMKPKKNRWFQKKRSLLLVTGALCFSSMVNFKGVNMALFGPRTLPHPKPFRSLGYTLEDERLEPTAITHERKGK